MEVRIDKWLWSVRIFKTRTLATEMCKKKRITILGESIKPSRNVKINEIIEVFIPPMRKKYRVKGLLDKRVSAKLAVDFVEDLTPPEEILKMKEIRSGHLHLEKGRPTKKDRRQIDNFKNSDF